MKNLFFITGLPRSRTAWFAAYLSAYPDVFCWHEALKECPTPERFHNMMEPHGLNELIDYRLGNSDSMLMFTDFQQRWPDAPTVVIHRDPPQVASSVERMFGGPLHDGGRELLDRALVKMKRLNGLHMPFEDVDNAIESIHAYLGIPYRDDIYQLFQKLRITTTDLKVEAGAMEWVYGRTNKTS